MNYVNTCTHREPALDQRTENVLHSCKCIWLAHQLWEKRLRSASLNGSDTLWTGCFMCADIIACAHPTHTRLISLTFKPALMALKCITVLGTAAGRQSTFCSIVLWTGNNPQCYVIRALRVPAAWRCRSIKWTLMSTASSPERERQTECRRWWGGRAATHCTILHDWHNDGKLHIDVICCSSAPLSRRVCAEKPGHQIPEDANKRAEWHTQIATNCE